MSGKGSLLTLLLALVLGTFAACGLLSPQASFARTHPEGLSAGRPLCSECHSNETMKGGFKTFASFDHTPSFVGNHRSQAIQDSASCATCHAPAFCTDCHGGKVAMSPSVKLGDRPDRISPHRGSYLSLHRLEARMDPTGCYKCHGRANNDKCAACHRRPQ
ncbi:MAG: cytochrome C [Acidobacteria bacterium]|nr:cytochrome C [Acidobacteriota bacterium]